MEPCLPQNDSKPEMRENQLERSRHLYHFNYDYVPPIPMLDHVPQKEYFSVKYTAGRLMSMADLPPNMLASKSRRLFDPLDELDEFDELFVLLDKPGIAKNYRTDESFGEQRLSGVNPMSIHCINELPAGFPLTDEHLSAIGGISRIVREELKENRLYFLEFPQLSHVEGGTYRERRKYLPKPRAMFYWDEKRSRMLPVAIQITGKPGDKLLTPNDPELDWFLAKVCVQIADATAQELGTHFARTHVAMAPFAVVTNRQLSEKHPLFLLFKPHFRFMLFDNELGRTRFIQPGGPVEKMMAGTLEESIGIAAAFYKEWSLDGAIFPREIASRNMYDSNILPHYPFRDDGMLVWNSVRKFVGDYIAIYYQNPADILQDHELQAWASELAAQNGGRVAGMPARIETVEKLADIVTIVIFTCGPLHSVLNFSQYEYMGYVPNMPYAAYHPVPENGSVDMATLMKFFPPYEQAALQLKWTEILTSYHYDRLGYYDEPFEDPKAQAAIERFRSDLDAIEREIDRRNQNRPVQYKYFKPSEIINSINT